MVVDEVMLRAFVDGELEPGLRQQVESAVANSPSLQAQVQALRASCLPYRAAFDAQTLPPPPATLVDQVAALVAVAGAATAPSSAPTAATRSAATLPRRAWLAAGLAASFAAGVVLPRALGVFQGGLAADGDREPWVAAIAQYHALYVRETVDKMSEAPNPLPSLLAGFDPPLRLRLRVPDLSAHGLAFRRAQRLGYGDAPLIQLVYLPQLGRPLAVCFLPAPGPGAPVRYAVVDAQNVAAWREGGLAFVVVGDFTPQALRELVPAIQSQVLA